VARVYAAICGCIWRTALARRPRTGSEGSLVRPEASVIAGVVFGAFTLAFLMWLVLGVDQIQCSKTALIALVFGLGTALSTSFIGGYASAKGPAIIPQLGNRPISIALGGGFLALVIASAAAWFIVRNNCVEIAGQCDPRPPLSTRISCGKIFNLKPPPEGDGFLAVRTGPTTLCANKLDDELHNDDQVIVRAARDKWFYVKRFSSRPYVEGWSYGDYITNIECPPGAPTK
jgi:hypothetical protein